MEVRNKVRGIAHDLNVAKITLVGVPDKPGIAVSIFEPLAKAGISIDTIVQNASVQNFTDMGFTVAKSDLARAMEVVEPIARSIGARECVANSKLGKISIVGTGMQNVPGYAARMFRALSDKGINIQLITTSEIRITCIVDETRVNLSPNPRPRRRAKSSDGSSSSCASPFGTSVIAAKGYPLGRGAAIAAAALGFPLVRSAGPRSGCAPPRR